VVAVLLLLNRLLRSDNLQSMRVPIPSIAIPAVVLLLYLLVPGMKERPWTTVRIVGAVLAVTGYVLVTLARLHLGKSFTVMPEARALVTHGIYSRIRNPQYVFVDVMVFGIILVFHWPWLFLALAGQIGLQVYYARREATVLQEKFGEEYLEYRKRTWF
jgi:protein-S-isoprenylcysteine O-methyltransferase Ste14